MEQPTTNEGLKPVKIPLRKHYAARVAHLDGEIKRNQTEINNLLHLLAIDAGLNPDEYPNCNIVSESGEMFMMLAPKQ